MRIRNRIIDFLIKSLFIGGFAIFQNLLIINVFAEPVEAGIDNPQQGFQQNPGAKIDELNELIHKDTNDYLEVPPVYKRPLGIGAGERIFVKNFIVNGVIEHPEKGITQKKIDTLTETLRLKLQSIDSMNEFGLHQDDFSEISKQVQDAVFGEKEATFEDYQKLIEQLRNDKKYREEMSIGQLQEVANQITDLYRSAGFVIAQAFVPEQTIEDGVVTIEIHEGVLGKTLVTGNELFSSSIIQSRFVDLAGQTVTKNTLENALLSLNDYPRLVAYGVLQPGENSGESDLVIKVQEEQAFDYTVKFDNHGSELTGKNRLTFSYNQNNLFGNADELNLTVYQTYSPNNTTYGGLRYKSPIVGTDYLLGGGFINNTFDIGGELADLEVGGELVTSNIFVSKQFIRSRGLNIFGKLDIEKKTAETTISGTPFRKDTLADLVLEVGFDELDSKYRGINQGSIKLAQGFPGTFGSLDDGDISSRSGGSGAIAISDFTKLNWTLARLQLINKHQNILLRFSGQYSGDILVPVEQIGMGGPNNVRAFSVSEYLTDSSSFFSVDWNFNAPGFYDAKAFDNWKWGEILQFSVFFDYSVGSLNDPTSSNIDEGIDEVSMSGYGVSAQLLLPGELQLRFDVGVPLINPRFTDTNTLNDNDDVQFYFTLSYTG